MSSPRVSVICIFYNEERFLAEAVESVLAQSFTDFELLLVDDGSSDDSTRIALEYAEKYPGRVRYLDHPGHANRGMSAARNLGFGHARGELFAVMDGDDRWRPDKLMDQIAILDTHPDVGMACGGYNEWHSWAGGKDRSFRSGHVADAASFPPETSLKVYPLGWACNPTDPMVRRSVVEKVGGYEEEFRGLYEDQVFLSKAYLATGVFFSSRVWLDYRRHPASCTAAIPREEYDATRRRFLKWYSGYIGARDIPAKDEIVKAVERAMWELEHPLSTRVLRLARRGSRGLLRRIGLGEGNGGCGR